MNAASILIGLAWTLGVFAVAGFFIWLIFRGVEREIAMGGSSYLASRFSITLFACINAASHFRDGGWWSYFLVAVAVLCVIVTWREWRRERA